MSLKWSDLVASAMWFVLLPAVIILPILGMMFYAAGTYAVGLVVYRAFSTNSAVVVRSTRSEQRWDWACCLLWPVTLIYVLGLLALMAVMARREGVTSESY